MHSAAPLFIGSTALAFVLAAVGSAALWVEVDSQLFLRTFGAASSWTCCSSRSAVLALRGGRSNAILHLHLRRGR
jgi:hypothetical protein